MRESAKVLFTIYKKLYKFFGLQHWWPGDTSFEVMVGAILTQNTNWQNVERAIDNLKKNKCLSAVAMKKISQNRLAQLIRPAGYYNIKAKRLKNFVKFLFSEYKGQIKNMRVQNHLILRAKLLSVNGIGQETADSILLYALNKPIFVVDAYTKRVLSRHKLISEDATYNHIQDYFMNNLKKDRKLFNEYHALIVRLGKDICKTKPNCSICPLEKI